MVRHSRLYPVVVTEDPSRRPFVMLGHGLGLALAHITDRGSQMYYRDDIAAFGADLTRAYLAARDHLHELVDARFVDLRLARGPRVDSLGGRRVPLFVVRHSLLAASCLITPDFWERAASALGASELAAAIPRHDLLIVFPDGDAGLRQAMRAFVSENVTLTSELFGLDASGPRELRRAAPRTSRAEGVRLASGM
jgi:hypothetical protein